MRTKVIKINPNYIDEKSIKEAGKVLLEGGLVALPTETVYGLGANALNADSSKKTYEVKGRPSDNPLIIHIAKIEDLDKIVVNKSEKSMLLADKFWPGPLTVIFEKSPLVPYGTTGGLESVAVRMPKGSIALAIIEAGGGFVSAPSANISGRPSPTTAAHVIEDLDGKIEMIIDGGAVEIGLESTVIDMTSTPPTILRPGAITPKMIEEIIGTVKVEKGILPDDSAEKPKAPGTKYRHYAPKGEMYIVKGDLEQEILEIQKLVKIKLEENKTVGVIATAETYARYKNGVVKNIGSRGDMNTIAENLYKVIREFDEEDVEIIFSESLPLDGIGEAIMNRLDKAAGGKYIQVSSGKTI